MGLVGAAAGSYIGFKGASLSFAANGIGTIFDSGIREALSYASE